MISAHPAVMEVGVAGVPDAAKGEVAKAYVVLKEGQSATEDAIRAYCRERLAPYKVPASVEFRNFLPKTMVGKILRRALAETRGARVVTGMDQRRAAARTVTPASCRAARKRRASSAAPGVSPCTHRVSTVSGTREPSTATTDWSTTIVAARASTAFTSETTPPGESARRQLAVGQIATIREGFGRHRHAGVVRRAHQLRVGQPEQHQRRIHRAHRPHDCVRKRTLPRSHVVQGAMRLDVRQPHTLRRGDARQRADLVGHQVLDLSGLDGHLAPAKPIQVAQAGVSAHRDAVSARQGYRGAHHSWIAGVETAGNIGRGDVRHHALVIAVALSPGGLAHVGIQVNS